MALIEGNCRDFLSRAEVREFGELTERARHRSWRSPAARLAIRKLINYLNSLVIRAHGKIYRAETQGLGSSGSSSHATFRVTFERTSAICRRVQPFAVFAEPGWSQPGATSVLRISVYLSGIEYQIKENNQWWLV
ncbi:MAG: hypothetical protein IPK58_16505 [Acidobacteria bacterium]|nr:hypothetical protein [Acidobacteriota bacterium]